MTVSEPVIQEANRALIDAPPLTILRWAVERFRPRAALSCSFGGPGGVALAHMLTRIDRRVPLLFVDTGLLFAETYALRQQFAQRFGLMVQDIRPDIDLSEQTRRFGDALWEREPDRCCQIRKVEPMRRALQGLDCWITALRRDQSATRFDIDPVEAHWMNGRLIAKVQPLARWTREEVWAYLAREGVPYNPLLDEGYASLGCTHCTQRPVDPADERSGRWVGHSKTECGLHTFSERTVSRR